MIFSTDLHGKNTARGARFLLGFSVYLVLTKMNQVYLILASSQKQIKNKSRKMNETCGDDATIFMSLVSAVLYKLLWHIAFNVTPSLDPWRRRVW